MSKTIHRQIGRLGSRSADEATVGMIIKDVDDMDVLLGKLIDCTKKWRDSWSDILLTETHLADSFHDVYQTIPRASDTAVPPEETPHELLHRVAKLHSSHNDLKNDMMEEVGKIEGLLISPMTDCKAVLKPLKKAIEKREHKKLDYERFNKAVESAKSKKSKTDRDYASQSKNEAELERATLAYEIADGYIRDHVPPILAKIVEFLPLVVEIAVQVQFTLLQNAYSSLFHYASEHGFTDPEGSVVVEEWEGLFMPVKQHVESELRLISKGKAILMPMNAIQETNIIKKRLPSLPSNPLAGRGKKPPPPPAPRTADGEAADDASAPLSRGRENNRLVIGKSKSIGSMSSRFSRQESSPPPPVPSGRPAIGSIRSRTQSFNAAAERDESPPPPLPGPRPTDGQGVLNDNKRPDGMRIGSYGSSMGGGSVTPTPLAGLKPSALRGGNENDVPSSLFGKQSPGERFGRTLAPSPAGGSVPSRSPSSSELASIVAKKKKPPPPPPKKKFAGPKETWVKAVFAFESQDRNDLQFNEGDRIKVLKKTDSLDDWWEGEINGRKGQFPANYCEPCT